MEIKVKYSNGKLLSNKKDIILANVASVHELAKNDPFAISTSHFFGIAVDGDGERRIFVVVPVRSLADDDVIYLYLWDKYNKKWHRLDRFTETRTLFDSYDECVDFYMESEMADEPNRKTIADELLDEADGDEMTEIPVRDFNMGNFEELRQRVEKIGEYRKVKKALKEAEAKLANSKTDLDRAEAKVKDSQAAYKQAVNIEVKVRMEVNHQTETVEKLKKQLDELDKETAESELSDACAFWDGFFARCFGE